MKHTILSCLIALTSLLAYGQKSTRTVLYSCGPNEEFFQHEFFSNMKTSGHRFACMTKNRNNSKLTFILNGEPAITSEDLTVYWIDVESKDNCIYRYSDGNEEYIVIDGHKLGPYENIGYKRNASEFNSDGTPNLEMALNRNLFTFKRMGKIFRHDNDGAIYECRGDGVWDAKEEDPVYTSPDGQHQARFSRGYRLLTIDGTPYVMPIDLDADPKTIGLRNFYITDDGVCIVRFEYNNGTKWVYPYIVIQNQTVEQIKEGEYFDALTNTIRMKGRHMDAWEPHQFESMRQWKDGDWTNGIDITLKDTSNRHFLTANGNYDYVMIDDKKFGKGAPINAFYDPLANAFGWVVIEGRNLVLYTYNL
ncbi:MAG: hypothetical protein K2N25_07935 [Muribaculaceae bacterium]|nr:hypothetical protein [Muribaculaceae bacterium]